MGIPHTRQARRFFRCAMQRNEEAKVLRREEMTTGSIYLAGYAIECILKALLLDSVPEPQQRDILSSFRGPKAHNYDWLRREYRMLGGAAPPRQVSQCFLLVADWSTELRYRPQGVPDTDADMFLDAVQTILDWARERF